LGTFFVSRLIFGLHGADLIFSFVPLVMFPVVARMQTAPKIFGGDLKSHCLFFESFTSETWEENRKAFTAAAKDFKGRALFITLDVDKPDNGRILEFFGITAEQTPTYRVINVTENMEKFAPPTSETTEAAISAFVGGYLDGTVKPHVNTEEIPDDWDAKPVKVLVGKNFEEVALDTTKDVFVEFYAPWCGHCKSLAPIFDQLGEAFESSGVVVAKMDSTSNDAAGITVESFPTLKLFPKGDAAEVIDFDGDRELLSMAEFLVEKTGVAMPTLPESEAAPEGEDASTEGTGAGPDGHEEGHDEL
jgi:protein disulfide-isomerase A1